MSVVDDDGVDEGAEEGDAGFGCQLTSVKSVRVFRFAACLRGEERIFVGGSNSQ